MPNSTISGLPAGTPAQATDRLPIARGGANYYLTPADILSYGSSPITGTTITATTGFNVGAGPTTYMTMTPLLSGSQIGFARADSGNVMSIGAYSVPAAIMVSTGMYAFGSSTTLNGTYDAVITRYAAKQLMISADGTGATTNAGWILGYFGSGSFSGMWTSLVTPSNTNAALIADATSTYLNGASAIYLRANGVDKVSLGSVAGAGPSITAGTTADNTQRALSITQTWTNGTSSNKAILANITVGTGTGNLLELQAGGTNQFSVNQAGIPNVQAGGSTTISTGVGSVKMSTANPATNAAWIPISYAGTTYYVPAYTTNAP